MNETPNGQVNRRPTKTNKTRISQATCPGARTHDDGPPGNPTALQVWGRAQGRPVWNEHLRIFLSFIPRNNSNILNLMCIFKAYSSTYLGRTEPHVVCAKFISQHELFKIIMLNVFTVCIA